jgi:hypothetical protein
LLMKYVRVKFDKGTNTEKGYDYKTDLDLKVGDKVVVDTQFGLSIATVHMSTSTKLDKATKFVVTKIDLDEHEERVEKAKKAEEVRELMEARLKEIEEIKKYEELAKDDPKMAELVKQLKELE